MLNHRKDYCQYLEHAQKGGLDVMPWILWFLQTFNMLFDGFEGKLNSSKWYKINHCSQDTANRDIKDLIAKGILRPTGEGGRSINYELFFP
ncbi:hypothetical protein F8Q89_00910 [Prevotella copri]|nr:hypothetical protein [Segatella copri]